MSINSTNPYLSILNNINSLSLYGISSTSDITDDNTISSVTSKDSTDADSIQISQNAYDALYSTNQAVSYGQPYGQTSNKSNVNFSQDLTSALDSLVSAGTITQGEEDKITSYMQQKADERSAEMDKLKSMSPEDRKTYFEQNKSQNRPDPLKDLVDQNVITQDQADSIIKAIQSSKNQSSAATSTTADSNNAQGDFKAKLDSLVSAGTITKDQEDKIIEDMEKKEALRKAEMEKANPLENLINQNITTQDQADLL